MPASVWLLQAKQAHRLLVLFHMIRAWKFVAEFIATLLLTMTAITGSYGGGWFSRPTRSLALWRRAILVTFAAALGVVHPASLDWAVVTHGTL